MNAETKVRCAPSINGHMISLGVGRLIAVYERDGERYVAEFRDGSGELEKANSWFRVHAPALRYPNGRIELLSAALPPEIVEKIERLHVQSEARRERILAVPRNVAAMVRRYLLRLKPWTRRFAYKTRRTVG